MKQPQSATTAATLEARSQRNVGAARSWYIRKQGLVLVLGLVAWTQACGRGSPAVAAPVILSVSLTNAVFNVTNDGSPVFIPVIIVAPTETASFIVTGLPSGVSATYKESESNPSGQLTLTANTTALPGNYVLRISVGSSGQMASIDFTLVVQAH